MSIKHTYIMVFSPSFLKKAKFCLLGCPDRYTPEAIMAKLSGGTKGIPGLV